MNTNARHFARVSFTLLVLCTSGTSQLTKPFQSDADTLVQQLRHLPTPLPLSPRSDGSVPPEEQQRRRLYQSLLRLGPSGVLALSRALGDDDVHLRRNAALALNVLAGSWYDISWAKLDIRPALPTLVAALQDTDSNVRGWSAQAIGDIGPDAAKAVPDLITLLSNSDEGSRNSACISFALALMLAFVAAIGAASPDCSVGDVRFACPKNFKQVPLEPTQQFGLYYWKKYNVGVFVAAPVAGYDESKFMANVIRTSLAKMFPRDSQEFSWKGVPYYRSGRISKFEIDGTIAQAFNGSLGILIKYRRLKFNGRDIIVGYASDFGRGAEAKEAFDRGLGGDSMPGCYAAVDITYSITGEKMPENNPCDIIASVP